MWQIVKRKEWFKGCLTLENQTINSDNYYLICIYDMDDKIIYSLSVLKSQGNTIFNKLSEGNLL